MLHGFQGNLVLKTGRTPTFVQSFQCPPNLFGVILDSSDAKYTRYELGDTSLNFLSSLWNYKNHTDCVFGSAFPTRVSVQRGWVLTSLGIVGNGE